MPDQKIEKEIVEIKEDITTLKRVVFGDGETKEKGMKEKVDEIHTLLTQSRGVVSFFVGIKGLLTLALALGAFVAYLKGWFINIK